MITFSLGWKNTFFGGLKTFSPKKENIIGGIEKTLPYKERTWFSGNEKCLPRRVIGLSFEKRPEEKIILSLGKWFNPYPKCRNPSLGLATKARACKGVGQEWSPRVTSHAPGNVGKCEGMNLHIPKWTLVMGIGLSNFQKTILGVNFHWIEKFLISLEISWNLNVENGFTWPVWVLKTQVMAKWRAGSQIANLTPDH